MIERPLDFLNNNKGKRVLIFLKGDKIISGELLAFDIHINLCIDNAKIDDKEIGLTFLRGDSILYISLENKKGDTNGKGRKS